MIEPEFLAVDLFAGAGGLSVGLEQAGFKMVLANEIEDTFAKTYSLNHRNARMICRPIQEVDFNKECKSFEDHKFKIVCGGPPCQGFSTVGSKNQHDERNNLFVEFLRAVKEINPSHVLFENVSGFKRLYAGIMFDRLVGGLNLLGYETNSSILEASDFGLPQKRQRTIVIGWRKGLPKVNFPLPTHFPGAGLFSDKLKLNIMDAISDLPGVLPYGIEGSYKSKPLNEYQRKMRFQSQSVTEHHIANYGSKMVEILGLIPPGGSVEDLPSKLRPKKYFKNTYARLFPDEPSPTITRNFGTPSSSRCIHPFENRALSTREGARLQGFPDCYKFYGSKTFKNLQIGNAVPPIFGEVLGLQIKKCFTEKNLAENISA